jgi:MbtH protein
VAPENVALPYIYFDLFQHLWSADTTIEEAGGYMKDEEPADSVLYHVVVNDEEQYSIWPSDLDIPRGWLAEGRSGSKQECLEYIGRVWTDMRPKSLRLRMDRLTRKS